MKQRDKVYNQYLDYLSKEYHVQPQIKKLALKTKYLKTEVNLEKEENKIYLKHLFLLAGYILIALIITYSLLYLFQSGLVLIVFLIGIYVSAYIAGTQIEKNSSSNYKDIYDNDYVSIFVVGDNNKAYFSDINIDEKENIKIINTEVLNLFEGDTIHIYRNYLRMYKQGNLRGILYRNFSSI